MMLAVSLIFGMMLFYAVHRVDHMDDNCDKAHMKIDLAVAQLHRMGISITRKGHGMEMHCVMQM